ncbi:ATPase inhibitor A, mitochondrial-like [Anopheles marshallii]|uniref:ATPase inhibitor A, mitochondrial-like n=1 Tax=Anopheles marshallii TaxID=1521116 RepID=UPI00237B378F|nr:ATPase inhibitor A, mitochondrial-like [Anopheles marshallii]
MFALQYRCVRLYPSYLRLAKMSQVGEMGSGAGKGGGGGGAIREAGGSFGKMEAAHEEEYFYKQQREQLAKLKTSTDSDGAAKSTSGGQK